MSNEKDQTATFELVRDYGGSENTGLLRRQIEAALTTARKEAQRDFVNNIAAVLGADDVEAFTALVMKAKKSPDLDSEARSALTSEAEIRKKARAEAFKEAFATLCSYCADGDQPMLDAEARWYYHGEGREQVGCSASKLRILEAAATDKKGANNV